MQRLLAELQRRKVLRVATAYLVVGWAIVQAASTLEAVLNLPGWFDTFAFALVTVGFPIALVVTWFYEITPEGVRRTTVSGDGKMHPPQVTDWVLLGAAVMLGLFIAFRAAVPWMAGQPAAPVITATAPKLPAKAPPALGDKSIAVLPFANLTPDKENDYFADGLTEELLNILAKIGGGLKVVSRTSSFAFKGKSEELPTIAAALGVRHVLEGSVRRDGDMVRITAQLIDVATDTHLWSETYDRKLDRIFAIQDEIARAIAGKLNIAVSLAAPAGAPTENIEAYRQYLEARELFRSREKSDMTRGLDLLSNAVALDDNFAEAHALRAAIHYVQAVSFSMFEGEGALALTSAKRARELKPDLALPYAIEGGYAAATYDWQTGIASLRKAVEREPSDTTARLWLATALLETGQLDEGANTLIEAHRLDPLYSIVEAWLMRAHFVAGNREEAVRVAEHLARGNTPLAHYAEYALARDAYDRGDAAEAERHYRASEEEDVPKELVEAFVKALHNPRAKPAAIAAIKTAAKDPRLQPQAYFLFLKDYDAVIDLLNEGFDGPEQGATLLVSFDEVWLPRHKALRNDPRFQDFLRRRGFVDYWRATRWPDICRAKGIDGFACD